jgi:very-short-patch-repair endonuclease
VRYIDFYWPKLRACLEIDSVEYHFRREDWAKTWDRHLDLSMFGYAVIHRPPSALWQPEKFVRDVRAWLAARAADLRRGLG